MCNACGFLCCASDCFEGCGCDHCSNPACWPQCDNCGEPGCDGECGGPDEDYGRDCAPRVVNHQNNPLSAILRDALSKNQS